ncbi:hypothetical protein GUJ93_ZPchr0007g4776 [Zizania palustris]|uniref:Secreted protein n=1 Tax=Zizania palustris TaxID=103762 RepID=A0A8J5SQU0_ZIZPA|nr:hypothetical protein GUJ93_ZPchr0007g4776 [Zizania palustris]
MSSELYFTFPPLIWVLVVLCSTESSCSISSSSSSSNKEKRPPLKRGQLKLQIAKTIGSLVVPGRKNREHSFRR